MMVHGYFLRISLFAITFINFGSCQVPIIYGLAGGESEAKFVNGYLTVPAATSTELRIFGSNLSQFTHISFAKKNGTFNSSCTDNRITEVFAIKTITDNLASTTVNLKLENEPLYVCAKVRDRDGDEGGWFHQGSESWYVIQVVKPAGPLMVLWLQIILITFLFSLSGLFSGLNLGLMSLDPTELKIIERAGSSAEKRYAKKIRPIRQRGNFLLCTLLLGNVLVNNTLTILMDNLTGSGAIAVVASTFGIVLFGEIIPQAICSRHGLAVGARTMIITKFFMIATFPLSFPISVILDKVLGDEIGQVFSRDKLGELIRDQGAKGFVQTDEVNIITGALSLTKKTVKDVMTPLEDAYLINYEAILDFDTMNEIIRHGFTRIPVYKDNDKTHVCAVLNVKDLAFIDPDDKTPLKTVCQFYQRPVIVVDSGTKLDMMLSDFRQGKAHMAFVEVLDNESECDPFHQIIGLVTLEDVIEEIIQAEINDETDIITDNVRKQRRFVRHQDFSVFNVPDEENRPRLSPQMKVAACQHMSSNICVFSRKYVSVTVLQKLLNQDIVVNYTHKRSNSNTLRSARADGPPEYLYQAGKPADYAILILQGRARVKMAKDNLIFMAGPFMFFGEGFLEEVNKEMQKISSPSLLWKVLNRLSPFVPDYTLEAETDLEYLRISRGQYVAARLTSDMQEHNAADNEDVVGERFKVEWDRQRSMIDTQTNSNFTPRPSRGGSSTCLDATGRGEPAASNSNGEISVTLPDVRVEVSEPNERGSADNVCNNSSAIVLNKTDNGESTPFLNNSKVNNSAPV